jgi:hypothetical protein
MKQIQVLNSIINMERNRNGEKNSFTKSNTGSWTNEVETSLYIISCLVQIHNKSKRKK